MNPELLHVLAGAGIRRRLAWDDIVVLQNYGPVPVPPEWAGDRNIERGLNFLILEGAKPTHFCKCRSANNVYLNRETLIRRSLAPVDAGLRVPSAESANSHILSIQTSRFLDGPHFGMIVPGQTTSEFVGALELILSGLRALADRSVATLDGMGDGMGRREAAVDFAGASLESLRQLSPVLNVNGASHEACSMVLDRAGELTERPQHGDLWFRNVIRFEDQYWAIDLEEYGDIRVPLFDDLTLLVSALAIRQTEGGVQALCADGEEALACRSLLARRARSEGVSAEQLDAVLAFYVLVRAHAVYFRAGPKYAFPHLRTARYVLERFERGDRGLLQP